MTLCLPLRYLLRHFQSIGCRQDFGEWTYSVMEHPPGVWYTPNLMTFYISYGRTWLQNHMPKFPPKLRLSQLRLEALPSPSVSLYLTLMSTVLPLAYLCLSLYANLCGVLDKSPSFSVASWHSFCLNTRVASWALLPWHHLVLSAREGHNSLYSMIVTPCTMFT